MTMVIVLCALTLPGLAFLLYGPTLYLISLLKNGSQRTTLDDTVVLPLRVDTVNTRFTLVVVATKIDDILFRKLNSLQKLKQRHPDSRFLIGLDGVCPGAANERFVEAHGFADFVFFNVRVGKDTVLTKLHEMVDTEIVVMSDVDAIVSGAALNELLKCFNDKSVGVVSGRRQIEDKTRFGRGQRRYASLDALIKTLELKVLGSITSNEGKLYGIRRECLDPLPNCVADDIYVGLGAIQRGRRLTYAHDATALIGRPSRNASHELVRRRRVVNRGLASLWFRRTCLLPWRTGWYGVCLTVNKIFRRLLPFSLVSALALGFVVVVANLEAMAGGVVGAFRNLGTIEWVFYVAPVLLISFWMLVWSLRRGFGAAFYAAVGLAGTAVGVVDFVTGKRVAVWKPVKA